MINILLLEDDKNIQEMLRVILEDNNYSVEVAQNIYEAKQKFKSQQLLIIDINLPDGNGLDFVESIISENNPKIIFLTASTDEENMLKGLTIGHEYITKPFRTNIFLARIKNLIGDKSNVIKYQNIKIDTVNYKVYENNEEIKLTALEYKIIYILFSNINRVLTREQILDNIWDQSGNFVNNNTLSVYIKRIREKFTNKDIIKTIHNIGYKVGV